MAVELMRGDRIGAYTIIGRVACGGEGTVYQAEAHDGTLVALKQSKYGAGSPIYRIVVERAERLKPLIGKSLPCVCAIQSVFEDAGMMYVATDWIANENLDCRIRRCGPLTPAELVPLANDLFTGLDSLHGYRIVHRDIKPENLMTRDEADGALHGMLVDLGIALHGDMPRVTRVGSPLGTPGYAPPECITGGVAKVDDRTDLYSAGVTLFEALATCPFAGATEAELNRAIFSPDRPSLRRLRPELSDELDLCLQRLMAVSPDDRPGNAKEAAREVEEALENGHTAPAVAPVVPRPSPTPTPAIAPKAAAPAAFTLEIASGSLLGQRIPIPKKGVTLGRTTLNPDDTLLSRSHCRVKPTWRGLALRDFGSLNGLIYQNRRVRKVLLQPGDIVVAGATVLKRV